MYAVSNLLAGNDIRVVEADAFSAARFWDERVDRRLLVRSCNLHHVDAAAFHPLPSLRTLVIADNPRLPRDDLVAAVRRVDTLTRLDVSAGPAFRRSFDLVDLFRADAAVGLRLERLTAAENGIRTVGANLSSAAAVATLRSLDLAGNELTTLDDGLSLLRRLEHLGVKDGGLASPAFGTPQCEGRRIIAAPASGTPQCERRRTVAARASKTSHCEGRRTVSV